MKKYIMWLYLSIKLCFKDKMYYFLLLSMFILFLMVLMVEIPRYDSLTIGLCYEDSECGEEVADNLEDSEEAFSFKEYRSREELERAILGGRLECGFVFTDEFDDGLEDGDVDETVLCLSTPFSLTTEVAKEVVFAAVLDVYSDFLLEEIDRELYGSSERERLELLYRTKDEYLDSEHIFSFSYVETDVTGVVTDADEKVAKKISPLRGTIGLFIILMLYFSYAKKWEPDRKILLKALSKMQQCTFMTIYMVAGILAPMVMGILFAMFAPEHPALWMETVRMMVLIFTSMLWIHLAGAWIRNYLTYISFGLTILLLNAIICPVYMDLAVFVPAIEYLRWLMPLSWYVG